MLSNRATTFIVAVVIFLGLSSASPARYFNGQFLFRPAAYRGGVASESRECSEIGRDILSVGGNAIDAMVAMTFCVGVIGMYHTGIGGGGFMIVRDPYGHLEAIDFREMAPKKGQQDMYKDNVNGSVYGGLSVGIPGEVRGLEYAHKKWGRLRWQTVLQGAIHVAEYGFEVNADLEKFMDGKIKDGFNFLTDDPSWALDFTHKGRLVRRGETMTRKRYAKTLTAIAKGGSEAFYTGEIAQSMVDTIRANNGTMMLKDFKAYDVYSRPVLTTKYGAYTVHGISSPGSGAVSLNILKTAEKFGPDVALGRNKNMHPYVEAMRFGYGARQELGDPDFVGRIGPLELDMISDGAAKKIRSKIDPDRTQEPKAYDPSEIYTTESHGTSHLVAADVNGFAVSLTSTINLIFGSHLMDQKTGIILNNEMNDFSIPGVRNEFGFEPSEANFIRGWKRPLSSICPMIIQKDGDFVAALGAAGGSRIISATTQVAWRFLEGLGLRKALAEPRVHDQLMPNTVVLERGFDDATAAGLADKGHNVTWIEQSLSAVQAVQKGDDGMFIAAAEPRQKNSAGLTA